MIRAFRQSPRRHNRDAIVAPHLIDPTAAAKNGDKITLLKQRPELKLVVHRTVLRPVPAYAMVNKKQDRGFRPHPA